MDKTNIKAAAAAAVRRDASRPVQASAGRAARHPLAAGFRPASVALALAAAFVPYGDVLAQPAGAQVIHGQASLQQQGNSLLVTTQNGPGSRHSAIDWQSFSVPGGSLTHFRQPDAGSTSINRVLGNNPSAIFGTLSSNGRLVVVNPSGIAVGAGAVVDTAGFTASTLRMSDADALAGRLMFAGGDAGALKVDGTVIARQGDAVFIAPQVQVGSAALVQAPNGATLLAAGQSVEVTGRGLEGIRLHLQAPADRAVNLGTLQGDAVAIFAGQLQHSGLVQATGVTMDGGKVVLKAIGTAEIAGTVSATQGSKGGQVHATAADLTVRGSALVDVSGQHGGGEALLGGGWQGRDARIANAQRTTLEAGAQVRADAIASGDGGTIVAWSDGATRVQGTLSARGGAAGGDGGRIETSGHYLDMRGQVDTRAPLGRGGSLLLDPTNVYIASDADSAVLAGMSSDSPTLPEGVFESTAGDFDSLITTSNIKSWLEGGASVTVKTSSGGLGDGNITVVDPIFWTGGTPAPTPTPAPSLDLWANKDIYLHAAITGAGAGAALGLYSDAGNIVQDTGKSSAITVDMLRAEANAGMVSLAHQDNTVGVIAGKAVGSFTFINKAGLDIGSVTTALGTNTGITAALAAGSDSNVALTAGGGLTLLAPVSGSRVLLKTSGSGAGITQSDSGAVSASKLTVAAGGDVDLSLAANAVGTLAGRAGAAETNHSFKFSNRGDLSIGSGQEGVSGVMASFTDRADGGQIVLKATGSLTQTVDGDLRGSEVFAEGASVDLTTAVATVGPDTFVPGNTTGIVAGHATGDGGGFAYKSHNPVLVSTVKGMETLPGVSADGAVALTSPTGVSVEQPIVAGSIALKATGTEADVSVAADLSATGSGGVVIRAGKDVRFESSETVFPTVRSDAGPITVTAAADGSSAGAIFGQADFSTGGGATGAVTLQAKDDVSFDSIVTASGAAGGAVSVTSTAGSVTGRTINANGGEGASGGSVSVTAANDVDLYLVESSGGYSSETAGGKGGTVTITATAGSVVIGDELQVNGGTGGDGGTVKITAAQHVVIGTDTNPASIYVGGGYAYADDAPGGAGGDVTIEAGSGSVTLVGALDAEGGSSSKGPGGKGGSVSITAAQDILIGTSSYSTEIWADGGYGGYRGGAGGGDGGAITLESTRGAVSVRGWLEASGGHAYVGQGGQGRRHHGHRGERHRHRTHPGRGWRRQRQLHRRRKLGGRGRWHGHAHGDRGAGRRRLCLCLWRQQQHRQRWQRRLGGDHQRAGRQHRRHARRRGLRLHRRMGRQWRGIPAGCGWRGRLDHDRGPERAGSGLRHARCARRWVARQRHRRRRRPRRGAGPRRPARVGREGRRRLGRLWFSGGRRRRRGRHDCAHADGRHAAAARRRGAGRPGRRRRLCRSG